MTKSCPCCQNSLDLESFYKKPRFKDYPGLAGYSHICKSCTKKERLEYVRRNPDKAKNSDRSYHVSKYGITVADYNRMFSDQEGRCKACLRHQSDFKKRLVIDHDHKTGRVRGLLCISCNLCLGYVRDDISTLEALKRYLTFNSESADLQTDIVVLATKKVG